MPKPSDAESLPQGGAFSIFFGKAVAQNRLQNIKNREARCWVSLFL